MKIYLIQAKIVDLRQRTLYRNVFKCGESFRDFEYYKKREVADKNMKKHQKKWNEYKDHFAIFFIKEIEVIE